MKTFTCMQTFHWGTWVPAQTAEEAIEKHRSVPFPTPMYPSYFQWKDYPQFELGTIKVLDTATFDEGDGKWLVTDIFSLEFKIPADNPFRASQTHRILPGPVWNIHPHAMPFGVYAPEHLSFL